MKIDAREGEEKLSRPEEELIEPEVKVIKYKDEKEYACFDQEEIRQVGIIFEHYHFLWSYSISLEVEIASLKREIIYLNAQSSLWKEVAQEQASRGRIYLESWKKQSKLFFEREERQNKYRWIPWGLVVIEAAALILSLSLNISK